MKELQKTVESYITNRHKQKKYLAVLTALSIMISFVVPFTLIEPAISTTGDGINPMAANAAVDMLQNYSGTNGNIVDDVTNSPKESGTLFWANGCTTAAEIIESAKRQYFLGIAYDFCVFLENNFEPTGADAEGRVAVGGNVIATVSEGNYQIGAGDFGTNTALKDTDNYQGITDFAHLITNGYISKVDPYGTKNGGAKAADYNGDFFKRMVIGNYEESKHRHIVTTLRYRMMILIRIIIIYWAQVTMIGLLSILQLKLTKNRSYMNSQQLVLLILLRRLNGCVINQKL